MYVWLITKAYFSFLIAWFLVLSDAKIHVISSANPKIPG